MLKVMMMTLLLLPSMLRSKALFEALGDSETAHFRAPVFSAVPGYYDLSTGVPHVDPIVMLGFGFHNLDEWSWGVVSSVDYLVCPRLDYYHVSVDNAVSISFFGSDLYKLAVGYRSQQYWQGFSGAQESGTWFVSWTPVSDLNLGK